MPRPRVLSFGLFGREPRSPDLDPTGGSTPSSPTFANNAFSQNHRRKVTLDAFSPSPQQSSANVDQLSRDSPSPSPALQERNRSDSRASRPLSMIHTLAPVTMDVNGDTIPELQPIFTFLNSHSNKLYQEGYFLKLHDLDSRGRPSTDRTWTECFAQLVGTVLSLWDAAALDAAGEEGEVLPTFINLSDASIKMIESLPMNGANGGSLQNVLSISTAANNRYLLHFNSLNSLTQWTAGIRLAMYEHATLQEAYTGSLIAGKGKLLVGIKSIMDRARFKHEDWARVRFGAGTPWRRCWCVISPPDEKEWAKTQKSLKKRNNYDRKIQLPKGDIKFYDTRRVTKKTRPIATITDAFAAYAIYPQSKPLIDQSTLIKLEGLITIHSSPETTTEGFLFVMPEVHPAVTGFEMLLRWLFPVWDTFALYGRPNRLIADTLDQRGLMFAMPQNRRYGYIDILDVSGLIHTEGSQAWSERQWRSELKKLTSHRMNSGEADNASPLRHRRNTTSRTSLPSMGANAIRFDEDGSPQSSPVSRKGSPAPPFDDVQSGPRRVGTAPVNGNTQSHRRSVSDMMNLKQFQSGTPSRLSVEASRDGNDEPPRPPTHGVPMNRQPRLPPVNSDDEPPVQTFDELKLKAGRQPVTPVATPPAFIHAPSSKPQAQPYQAPELRRATSGIDAATLHQMHEATHQRNHDTQGPDYNGGGSPNEVAIAAENSTGVPADVTSRKEMVDRQANLLPTIPASPLPQNPEFSTAHASTGGRKSPQHALQPQIGPVPERKPVTPTSPRSEHSFSRKPVPSTEFPREAHRPNISSRSSESSVGGFEEHVVDGAALEELLQNDRTSTMASTVPDYSSVDGQSMKSGKSGKSGKHARDQADKPRAGRMKTVGDTTIADKPEADLARSRSVSKLDTFHVEQEAERNGDLPNVDFGPTYTYKPGNRPASRTAITPNVASDTSAGGSSAFASQRNSYFGDRTSPSPNAVTPNDPAKYGDARRRSTGWTAAGSPAADGAARQSLTPEQWVAHRASIASQPMQPMQPMGRRSIPNLRAEKRNSVSKRNSSAGLTTPRTRTPSGDWSQTMQRTPPANLSRPGSRNAGMFLQPNGSGSLLEGDHSRSLSAREQMHIARATGTPLVDLQQKDSRRRKQAEDPNAGLYGALQAREREKQVSKAGYQSTVVQAAIMQKQQQQVAELQARAQQQQQFQMQQAARAAQVAQHQAQMHQQAAYAQSVMGMQPSYAPSAMGMQQSYAGSIMGMQQQQPPSQYGQQQQQQRQQRRPPMQSQRSSQFFDAPQTPGEWNNAGMQPHQQQHNQQAPNASFYGGYPASTYSRPSPR